MHAAKRWLLVSALALSPVFSGASLADAASRTAQAPFVPWCCQVPWRVKDKPVLPGTGAARGPAVSFRRRLAGKRLAPGRLRGRVRRKRPVGGCFQCGRSLGADATWAIAFGERRAFCQPACSALAQDAGRAGLASRYLEAPPGAAFASALAEGLEAHYAWAEAEARPAGERLADLSFKVSNLDSGPAGWALERAFSSFPGVLAARVRLASGRLELRFDPTLVSAPALAAHAARAGFAPRPIRAGQEAEREHEAAGHQAALLRLGVAGFGAVATMFLAEPLYLSAAPGFSGQWLRFLGLVVGTGTGAYALLPILAGGLTEWRAGRPGMNALATLGALATYGASVAGFVTRGAVYFDALLMFAFLLLLGRFLESGAKGRARAAIERMIDFSAPLARVLGPGGPRQVEAHAVAPGDRLLLRPGDRLAVDGEIRTGRVACDESLLTGEPEPRWRGPGERVVAGAIVRDGSAEMTAAATASRSTAGKLERLAAAALADRPALLDRADAEAARLTVGALVLAALALVGWLLVDPAKAGWAAAAVLVVSCPCALGLAVPAALAFAIEGCMKRGILVRRPAAFTALFAPRAVVFDKTGTLTLGRPEVISTWGEPEAFEAAAVLEAHVSHPLAEAIVRWRKPSAHRRAADFCSVEGQGVAGRVGQATWAVGRLPWLLTSGASAERVPAPVLAEAEAAATAGRTVVWIAREGEVVGALTLADAPRPEAARVVSALQRRGVHLAILSGDREAAARRLGDALGILDVEGEADPARKREAVAGLRARFGGAVVMVGDGLNDAAALAAADVGVALARGADATLVSADVVLSDGELTSLLALFERAEAARRAVRWSFRWSALYNLIALPLAALGLVTPLLAAVVMPLSSLVVLARTARLQGGR